IGRLAQGVHKEDGALVSRAEYYRRWPYGEYVTTEARDHMRRGPGSRRENAARREPARAPSVQPQSPRRPPPVSSAGPCTPPSSARRIVRHFVRGRVIEPEAHVDAERNRASVGPIQRRALAGGTLHRASALELDRATHDPADIHFE